MNIEGEVVKAGTFLVDGEMISGVIVQVPECVLQSAGRIPFYRRVQIVEMSRPVDQLADDILRLNRPD
jgi:hypothetical protein